MTNAAFWTKARSLVLFNFLERRSNFSKVLHFDLIKTRMNVNSLHDRENVIISQEWAKNEPRIPWLKLT